jgi:hypothetical protein
MGIWKGQTPWLHSIRMKLSDKKEAVETILKSIDATVVFHNIMMDFNGSPFLDNVDLCNVSTITDIDDADQVPHPHKLLVLDMSLDDDDAPGTRIDQLLRLVEEHYIRPVYGSPVSGWRRRFG